MPEDEEVEEDIEEQEAVEDEAAPEEEPEEEISQQQTPTKGYTCVNCETDVELDPVTDKIICPKCSHRVLLKKRSEDPDVVEAV